MPIMHEMYPLYEPGMLDCNRRIITGRVVFSAHESVPSPMIWLDSELDICTYMAPFEAQCAPDFPLPGMWESVRLQMLDESA